MSRGNWVAEYADGRTEVVAVTEPIVFAVMGRDTLEEALVQVTRCSSARPCWRSSLCWRIVPTDGL